MTKIKEGNFNIFVHLNASLQDKEKEHGNTVQLVEAHLNSMRKEFQTYSIRGTVLSSIKCVSLNSSLNVVSFIILCHYDGVPGRSFQDTGGALGEKDWELLPQNNHICFYTRVCRLKVVSLCFPYVNIVKTT